MLVVNGNLASATTKQRAQFLFNDGITNLLDKNNTPSVSENDGNDNGETENEDNHDYSGAGYTNISTILFGTLMCKIVMIY